MIRLRKPTDKIADCYWLPRFIDKARLWHSGGLPFLYRMSFCSRLGLDGYFLGFFQLRKTDVLEAIFDPVQDDERIRQWFLAQPMVTTERIEEWNTLASRIGRKGYPGYWTFYLLKPALYPKAVVKPVQTVFEAIIQDEE